MNKIVIGIIILTAVFALGRYSVARVDTIQTIDTQVHKDVDTHTTVHTVTVKQPDGTTVTTTDSDTKKDSVTDKTKETQTETKAAEQSKLNVSLLASFDVTKGAQTPDYGLSVSTQLIGPSTIGLWGLKSGILGLSVGLNF